MVASIPKITATPAVIPPKIEPIMPGVACSINMNAALSADEKNKHTKKLTVNFIIIFNCFTFKRIFNSFIF